MYIYIYTFIFHICRNESIHRYIQAYMYSFICSEILEA